MTRTFAPQSTTTTLTITKATPTFTEAAAPSSIVYGSQDTLSDSGLPAGATGTVTFSIRRLDALRRNHPGDELPDRDRTLGCGYVSRDRDLLR